MNKGSAHKPPLHSRIRNQPDKQGVHVHIDIPGSMNLGSASTLRRIAEISEALCRETTDLLPSDHHQVKTIEYHLQFPPANAEFLKERLRPLKLSASLQSHLVSLSLSSQEQFIQYASRGLYALSSSLPCIGSKLISLLHVALVKKVEEVSLQCQVKIIEVVKSCVNNFQEQVMADNARYSSSEDIEVCRGHSKFATTILEKAFQYSSNITVAERDKLASATGLKAKQVTIWYQNRRNRKVAARPSFQGTTNQTFHPSSKVSQKRKRAELYGEMPRHPSHRLRPSSDSSVAREEDGMVNCLDISSSRSSSLETKDSNGSCSRHGHASMSCTTTSSFDSTCSRSDYQMRFTGDQEEDSINTRITENMKDEFIFDDIGEVRLDFHDLDLDIATIEAQLPIFGTCPSAEHEGAQNAGEEVQTGHVAFGQPFGELFPDILCTSIDKSNINSDTLVRPFLSQPLWEELWRALISSSPTGGEATLSLRRNDSTPSSAVTSDPMGMLAPLPQLGSRNPCNPFDFSLDGMGLSETISENEDTFYGQCLYAQFLQHEPQTFEPFRAETTFVDENWIQDYWHHLD